MMGRFSLVALLLINTIMILYTLNYSKCLLFIILHCYSIKLSLSIEKHTL